MINKICIVQKPNPFNTQDVEREKYFRLLAKIKLDGKDLTDLLIKNGYGYACFGETKKQIDWCKPLKE